LGRGTADEQRGSEQEHERDAQGSHADPLLTMFGCRELLV